MKNLIMADLKVLGHRLWSVPLMALVLVAGVSLIPGLEMADPVRNFMIALLSPCLLIFELFREEQKLGTDSLMLTMPVNKNVYVMAKYTTVIILSLSALPAGWIAAIFSNLIQGGGLSIAESISFLPNMLKIMALVIPGVYFIFPIYFFIRKIVVSALIGIILVFFVTERILTFFYSHFYLSFFDDNLHLIFYLLGIILIPGALIHLIIKFRFKSISDQTLKNGWFALIFILFIFIFNTLMKNLQFADYYFRIVAALDSSEGQRREWFLQVIRNFRLYVPVISFLLIMISATLFYIRKKSSQLFWQNAVLYFLAPLTIIIVSDEIGIIVSSLFTSYSRNYHSSHLVSVLAPILITIVSFRASVYLLKNNRTLK